MAAARKILLQIPSRFSAVPSTCPTITAAVQCIPNAPSSRYQIRVAPGIYNEKLIIADTKGPIAIVGLAPHPPSTRAGVTLWYAESSA